MRRIVVMLAALSVFAVLGAIILANRRQPAEALLRGAGRPQVVADRASIRHNYPKSRALIGHNTLFLANPRIAAIGDPIPGSGVIVISDEGRLATRLPPAIENFRRRGGSYDYVIPRTRVRLWQIEGGVVHEIDAGGITYLQISD